MSFSALTRHPRSNRWRLIRGALGCLLVFSLLFSMAAGSGSVNGVPSELGWPLGLWLWGLSLLLTCLCLVTASRIKRAIVFYSLEYSSGSLMMFGFLMLGLSTAAYQLGQDTAMILAGGVLFGFATTLARVTVRQTWYRTAIERGHLAKSLSREAAKWNTHYDFDQAAADLKALEGTSYFVRILPWIGPAVGIGLARVVGRANTVIVAALLSLALGYWGLGVLTVNATARILELRRLEGELGRPILLAEDDNPRKQ